MAPKLKKDKNMTKLNQKFEVVFYKNNVPVDKISNANYYNVFDKAIDMVKNNRFDEAFVYDLDGNIKNVLTYDGLFGSLRHG